MHEEFGKDVIENDDKIYVIIFLFVVKSESDRLKSLLLTLFDFFNNAQFVLIATPISWVKGDTFKSSCPEPPSIKSQTVQGISIKKGLWTRRRNLYL